MKSGLATRILLGGVALAVLIGVPFLLMLQAIGDQREAASLARDTQETLRQANRLERRLLEVNAGMRGFVITGAERFLEPWEQGRATFAEEADLLIELSTSEEQKARARAIRAAARSYIDDYSEPLADTARRDRAAAARIVASGQGMRRFNEIRALFDEFGAVERRRATESDARADSEARRAVIVTIAGLTGSTLLVLLFALGATRTVAVPARRLAEAAGRVASGDLSARVPPGGPGEIGQLSETFNTMAVSLQESRDERESQNAELEAQAAKLEDQTERVAAANQELEWQRAELELAVAQLGEEKERIDRLYAFGALVAAERRLELLAVTVLQAVADFAGAEVATLYGLEEQDARVPRLLAVRGLERDRLPDQLDAGHTLAARALAERRPLLLEHGSTGLRLAVLGEEVAVHHELHVPLVHANRPLGVLTLARVADRPFADDEFEGIQHVANQASVALDNAIAYATAQRLATVNRAVLDATPDGIVLVDLEGRRLVENEALRRLSGVSERDPDSTVYEEFEASAARMAAPDAFLAFLNAVRSEPAFTDEHVFEYSDDGRAFHVYTAPVKDEAHRATERIFVLREITREREAERLKTELLSTVSHELRTPLASILGYSELLATRTLVPEVQTRYVDTIHREARRLTDLVNDFLDLQRIEEGGLTLNLEPLDLARLLAEQAQLFSGQSPAHELRLSNGGPLEVLGDRDRLAQAVANLLSNAIKYSPEGGPIDVVTTQLGREVRVEVRDRGLGIPSDQRAQIFTRFFRVDSSDTRAIGGTGLGLALTREIVEAHGGRIGFDSVEGDGTTFWFELPSGPAGRGSVRVLVVEDDPRAAALIEELLGADGHKVEVTATGEDALERVRANPPAVICLDIGLAGGLDGWEVLGRLKASPASAAIPVVVCTAANDRERASALGAADFLTKPFSGAGLRDAIARVLPAGRGTVLVVDDDPGVRRLVVDALAARAFALREAADGEEALDSIAADCPDAVVLDLGLPGIDGLEVLERLRADPATRTLPVMILTARDLSDADRTALARKTITLLEKSRYSAEELRLAVSRAVSSGA